MIKSCTRLTITGYSVFEGGNISGRKERTNTKASEEAGNGLDGPLEDGKL